MTGKYPYSVTVFVSKQRLVELLRAARAIAGDDFAYQYGPEKTVFWFADEDHEASFRAAHYMDLVF